MPIWWRIIFLPASTKTLPSDIHGAPRSSVESASAVELTQRQFYALHMTSFVTAALSLVATVVAVASFLRMRRSFRHDLILLLMLSDMLKSLWLVVLPATELLRGTITSTSSLCQISGFFLSVGIEACDLAVLLMAVHSALYIFRGRTGLYPYRLVAYTLVAILSLMLPSLAFINKPAFVNTGPICYFPGQPVWIYRALSWIPRYVVVLTIMLIYTCIYTHVRYVMGRSGKTRRLQSEGQSESRPRLDCRNLVQQHFLPMNSPIAYSDSISTKPPCDHTMPHKALVQAARLNPPLPLHQARRAALSPFIWQNNERTDSNPRASSLPLPISSSCGACRNGEYHEAPDSSMSPMHCEGQEVLVTTAPSVIFNAQGGASLEHPSGRADLRIQDQTGLVLDGQGSISSNGETESPQLILSPATINAIGIPRVREKIRRQLGHLFVYPLVYMMGWLVPFITHIVRDNQTRCPFWLVLMSLVSLCIQGLADSVVFLMMEKPWRDWTRDDVAARCCLRWGKQSSMKRSGMRVGRTGEEMLIDGTIARSRRQRERTEHWPMATRRAGPMSSWWDLMLVGIDESNNDEAEVARPIG